VSRRALAFECQRAVLDALAEFAALGRQPGMLTLANMTGVGEMTARHCVLWLEHEGFVKVARPRAKVVRVELLRNPDDTELKAAIGNGDAS
jgi:DNA-binding transcriptional regulator YhcF (GntR family)